MRSPIRLLAAILLVGCMSSGASASVLGEPDPFQAIGEAVDPFGAVDGELDPFGSITGELDPFGRHIPRRVVLHGGGELIEHGSHPRLLLLQPMAGAWIFSWLRGFLF